MHQKKCNNASIPKDYTYFKDNNRMKKQMSLISSGGGLMEGRSENKIITSVSAIGINARATPMWLRMPEECCSIFSTRQHPAASMLVSAFGRQPRWVPG